MSNKTEYKSNHNIVYSCKYHIIWCPKYRRKVLVGDVEIRLKEIISEVALELNVEIIEMETDKDHIRILADVDPQFGVMNFVKKCKGRSSGILRDEFHHLKTKTSKRCKCSNKHKKSWGINSSRRSCKSYLGSQTLMIA